jgi:ABC-type uncharacterized transport system substrate-binding protein
MNGVKTIPGGADMLGRGKSIKACLVAMVAVAFAWAGDFDDVLTTVKATWPEKNTVGVLCDIDINQMALLDLTDAAKAKNMSVVVMNLKQMRDIEKQMRSLLDKHVDFVLLMDDDPIFGVKSPKTERTIGIAEGRGVPTVSISAAALKVGALFVVGADTKGRILASAAMAKKLKLDLPDGAETPKP